MMFGKKKDAAKPQITYHYEINPGDIDDGEHEFDGIRVSFSKPGWQWVILELTEGRWTRVHSVGAGFPTRDAALVDLLRAARDIELESNNG